MKRKLAAGAAAGTLLALMLPAASGSAAEGDEARYIIAASGKVSALSAKELTAAVEDAGGANVKSFSAIRSAVADLTEAEAKALDAQPNVVVSKDGPITTAPIGGKDVGKKGAKGKAVANSWGLDRIDQRNRPIDGQYTPPAGLDGTGVHAYVFDTGLALTHPEFAGRVAAPIDTIGDGRNGADCHGHGTHVSGTIASTLFGVAPRTVIHPVRVLNCQGSGSFAGFIDGMNRVAQTNPPAASVANASLGGGFNAAVNTATANFITATNMPYAIAAGNSFANVSTTSPASTPTATTVAASNRDDTHGSSGGRFYSNFGALVDLYAPGTDITSSNFSDPTRSLILTGTSMASPHVAGWYALYFTRFPTAPNSIAEASLVAQATPGVIASPPGGTVNRLEFTNAIPGRPVSPPTIPTNVSIQIFFGRAILRWQPPASGPPITGYSITRRTPTGLPVRTTLPPSSREFSFALTAGRQYTVTLAASNPGGTGRSAVRIFTAPSE